MKYEHLNFMFICMSHWLLHITCFDDKQSAWLPFEKRQWDAGGC